MKSKRYKKLPQNTKEFKADLIKNLLSLIKTNGTNYVKVVNESVIRTFSIRI